MLENFTHGVDKIYSIHFFMIFNLVFFNNFVSSSVRIRYVNWRSLPVKKKIQYNADKICSHNKAQILELSVLISIKKIKYLSIIVSNTKKLNE